ncbi:MAG: type VI secretion system membrane subunit TssM [Aliidongia sp.]
MNTIRRIFFHRWLATLIGCVLLSLLIWFVGPLIAIAGSAPLESDLVRFIVIGAVFLIWAIVTLIGVLRARRKDKELVSGLTSGPDAGEAEIAVLRARIEDTLKRLKSAPGSDGKRHLYELPWYMLIGPPGAGKTTALVKSGISFVGSDGRGVEAVRGIGGTRNCDWWFAEDAVLLDTAGRYTTQDSDKEADRKAWLGFIDLLKTYRPRAPINGALVVTPLVDLAAMSDDDRRAHARTLRERLAELRDKLGVEFPVYVVFTKLDQAAGFVEFFDRLSKEERRQVWGFTLPLARERNAEPIVTKVPDAFEKLFVRLSDHMFDRLQEESDPRRRMLIHGFPSQISSLRAAAEEFLDGIFSPSRYEHGTLLRGAYLTSGTQEGTPVDRIMGMLARSFGLPEARQAALTGGGRSYFLGDLLEKVVFAESRLVSTDPRVESRMVWMGRGVYGVSALAILATFGLWSWSALTNAKLIADTEALLPPYKTAVEPYADKPARDPDVKPIVPSLDRLRVIAGIDQPPAPFEAGFGLYQGHKLNSAGMQSYRRALNSLLLPRLLLRFDGAINATMQQPDLQYEVLKAYLMLGNAGPLDKNYVEQLVTADWGVAYPDPSDAPLRAALKKHLETLLAGPLANIPLDKPSIDRARANLGRVPLAERAYAAIKTSPEAQALPMWRLIDHAGPSADRVLIRRSGKPLTDGIPGLFTRDGFYHVFLPHFAEAGTALASERWVLGNTSQTPTATEAKALENNIEQLYETEYINRWDTMLGDLAVVPFHNNAEAAEVVGILASPTSPFRTLFPAVVHETQLTKPPEELATAALLAPGKASEVESAANRLNQIAKASGVVPAGQGQPGAAVEQHFKRLTQYVGTGTGPSPIDDMMRSLNDTYQQLNGLASPGQDLLHGTAASSSGQGLRKLQADAAQLPQPLAGMIGSIGQGATQLTAAGTREQLRQAWNSSVLPFCTQALEGRYPIKRDSSVDVTLDDFVRLFGAGGQIDAFFNTNMKNFVDTSRSPWRWIQSDNGDLGMSNDVLAQFQRASKIRDGFFGPGGAQPAMKFQITPTSLDAGTKQAILEVDAVTVTYAHGPPVPSTIQWPSPTGSSQVRLALQPTDDSTTPSLSATGPWAWFRLVDQGHVESGGSSDRLKLSFSLGAHQIGYDLQAGSVLNPLTLRDVGEFRCPRM